MLVEYFKESYIWEFIFLAGLAVAFQFIPKLQNLDARDQFFSLHQTTVVHASLCIVIYSLAAILFSWMGVALSNQLVLYLWKYLSLLLLLGFILSSYRWIEQPFHLIEFDTARSSSTFLAGMRAALLMVFLYDLYWLLVPETWLRDHAISSVSHGLGNYVTKLGMFWSGVVALITTCSWQGLNVLIEELSYRGLLYSALRKHFPMGSSLIASSVLFMLGHGWFSVGALGLGCLACYLYETHRSLLPAIMVHFTWNANIDLFAWVMSVSTISAKSWYAGSLVVTLLALGIVQYASKGSTMAPTS